VVAAISHDSELGPAFLEARGLPCSPRHWRPISIGRRPLPISKYSHIRYLTDDINFTAKGKEDTMMKREEETNREEAERLFLLSGGGDSGGICRSNSIAGAPTFLWGSSALIRGRT
jgi:hypothetical protein